MSTQRVLIIGSGTAGITVAARLRRARADLEVRLVAPAAEHYYQPLWTLVGGGLATLEETRRPTADLIPRGVEWIQDSVERFEPDSNAIVTAGGSTLAYDGLVVAPGLKVALDEVAGLREALANDPRVWTNYLASSVVKGPDAIAGFAGGQALFTKPRSFLKCGGAPQKIMWIAEESFRRNGVRDRAEVKFVVPGEAIFGVPHYAKTLARLADERGVKLVTRRHLIEVKPDVGIAVFEDVTDGTETEIPYGLLHVTPPMRAPDFVRESPLAAPGGDVPAAERTPGAQRRGLPQGADGGFVDVDHHTLQHARYPNVFALGDAAGLPTSTKTGAAVRKQAPVVVGNLLAQLGAGTPGSSGKQYDGYTSCPLVVGHNRVVLAEFGYEGRLMESFPIDQNRPRWSMWILKRHLLPQLYWHGMLRGIV